MSTLNDENVITIRQIAEEILELKDRKKKIETEIKIMEGEVNGLLSEFYTLPESAERLETSSVTMFKRIQAGRYTSVNYGGRLYIRQDEIQEESELKRRLARGI